MSTIVVPRRRKGVLRNGVPVPEVPPFTDDFNRADNTSNISSLWTPHLGVWGITGNKAYKVSSPNAGDRVVLPGQGRTSGFIEYRVSGFGTSGGGGLIRCEATRKDGVAIYHTPSSTNLYETNGFAQIGSGWPVVAAGDLVRVDYTPTTISVRVNGGTPVTVNNSTHNLGDRVGFYTEGTGATYDDFRTDVYQLLPLSRLGYNGSDPGSVASSSLTQKYTATTDGRVQAVTAKLDTGTWRVGYTAAKPTTDSPTSIPWLAYADLVSGATGSLVTGTLNTAMQVINGTAFWLTVTKVSGAGNAYNYVVPDVAAGFFTNATRDGNAFYSSNFGESLINERSILAFGSS